MYNSEEFSVINVIVSLSRGKCFGEIHARVEVVVRVFLHEHAAGGSERGISHDEEGSGMVGEREDRLLKKCLLYFGECDFVIHRPLPLGIFVSEGEQGFC